MSYQAVKDAQAGITTDYKCDAPHQPLTIHPWGGGTYMSISYEDAKRILSKHHQSHVLRFWDHLNENQKVDLLAQIETLDLDTVVLMQKLLAEKDKTRETTKSDIEPAEVIKQSELEKGEARRIGEEILRAGEVGVLLVAGGQGTRLGFGGPKGCFPLAPITNASLFAIHSRKILGMEQKYHTEIPFYIMTSQANDKVTRDFFDQHDCFGLSRDRLMFFTQGMWPSLRKDGKIILDSPCHIFMSPDGHGGVLSALRLSGMLEDMEKRGLKTVFYFQVDNPLVEIADPAFVGLHREHDAEMSVKVCVKQGPEEGIGVVVKRDGRNAIVEYTELTDEQKHEILPDGRLKFRFGSVAIHIFSLDFLRKEAGGGLPLHIAHKKVPYCDESGATIEPEEPNAYKFERFIFDVLPDAERALNVEFSREHEFSPVKNASGPDSPETARRDMMLKYAGWLEQSGVEAPRNEAGEPLHKIEIDPCFALGPDDLREKVDSNFKISGDVLLA